MKKFDVKVARKRPRKKRASRLAALRGRAAGAIRAVLMRPRLVMAGAFTGFVLVIGTPHLAWDYQCSHPMRGVGTCRAASWCAYYGVQGRRIDRPAAGETCDLVKFLRIDWKQLKGD